MNTGSKANYIDLIQKINVDQALKNPFINFIDSYDGNNHEDFKVTVMTLFLLLSKFAELELKAQAYDAIAENNGDYKAQLAALKTEYENFTAGKPLINRPHISKAK